MNFHGHSVYVHKNFQVVKIKFEFPWRPVYVCVNMCGVKVGDEIGTFLPLAAWFYTEQCKPEAYTVYDGTPYNQDTLACPQSHP